jgi:hypothetical protein
MMAIAARVLFFMLILAPAGAQPPSPYQEIATELAVKIAALVPAAERAAALSLVAIDGADQPNLRQLQTDMTRALAARGVRVVENPGGGVMVNVRVSCADNLRERACIADIQRGATRQAVAVTRPLDARAERPAMVSLDVQPLFSQRARILDAVVAGDRLVVLDPAALTRYQRTDAGWQRVDALPLAVTRVWPRDVRGRVRVDGARLDVFLPGVTCRSGGDGTRLACSDDRQPWPIGIDNTGVEANRNYFYTPEGVAFFGAAALGGDANARWLAAGPTGALLFLDENRRSVATIASGDDVAALNAPCVGPVVLVASSGRGDRPDTLRLFHVLRRQLIPAAAPVELPGRFTALWAAPGASVATVVAQDAGAERYDAFQIRLACDR